MTPESLNLLGDVLLIGAVLVVAAVPVLLLRGLYRQQRWAILKGSEVQITKGRQCERKS